MNPCEALNSSVSNASNQYMQLYMKPETLAPLKPLGMKPLYPRREMLALEREAAPHSGHLSRFVSIATGFIMFLSLLRSFALSPIDITIHCQYHYQQYDWHYDLFCCCADFFQPCCGARIFRGAGLQGSSISGFDQGFGLFRV